MKVHLINTQLLVLRSSANGRLRSISVSQIQVVQTYFGMTILSSTSRKPAGLCHGQVSFLCSCVSPCMCELLFQTSSETTHAIFMKLHKNDPVMVFFRISGKNFILSKNLIAMAKKKKIRENLLV